MFNFIFKIEIKGIFIKIINDIIIFIYIVGNKLSWCLFLFIKNLLIFKFSFFRGEVIFLLVFIFLVEFGL